MERFGGALQVNSLSLLVFLVLTAFLVTTIGTGFAGAMDGAHGDLGYQRPWTIWSTHGNHKIWPGGKPLNEHGASVSIQSARNEWEPFQVAVAAHRALSGLRIDAGFFVNEQGDKIPAPTAFRIHYIPIEDTANKTFGRTGMVPDALVPLIHPETGEPTGGKYGGDTFEIPAGEQEAFWFDVYVPKGTPAGLYLAQVKVSADGLEAVELSVELEVFDFDLPSPKDLQGFFQIGLDSITQYHEFHPWQKDSRHHGKSKDVLIHLAHAYEEMLHDHYVDNWSPITGWNYDLNGVKVVEEDGRITVDWSSFDKLVTPYMDGSAFRDGIPARALFVPYYLPVLKADLSGPALRVNRHNYKNIQYDLFAQWIREVQRHYEERGWLDRAYVFYFDEPFLQEWKYEAFIKTARIIRQEAPKLRIMITDGYQGEKAYKKMAHITEPITPYVDVWNPVTWQVRPETVEFYRERKREGKFDIWCQTLGNANPVAPLPNLFPEYDMPFHRIWGAMSWNFGFQGIEWWSTIYWYNERTKERIDPWISADAFPPFDHPLNADGRLFYNGTPDTIGGPDIPIGSLRMKALREAIEDYQYFHMLDELAHSDLEFDINLLHTINPERAKKMKMPMQLGGYKWDGPPAWQWWEGDPDRILEIREKAARLIVEKKR